MNGKIKRTEEEIKRHLEFIQNEINTRVGTKAELDEEIPCLYAIYDACYGALKIDTFDPSSVLTFEAETMSDRCYRDACVWLMGMFQTAPNYKPLREKQHSVHQVLEDFGDSEYTAFKL